jgi:hypothetical protein
VATATGMTAAATTRIANYPKGRVT